jgi:hypothetical protein
MVAEHRIMAADFGGGYWLVCVPAGQKALLVHAD